MGGWDTKVGERFLELREPKVYQGLFDEFINNMYMTARKLVSEVTPGQKKQVLHGENDGVLLCNKLLQT